jgi:6-phosphogluconolactonase
MMRTMTTPILRRVRCIFLGLALVCAAASGSAAELVYFGTQVTAAGEGIVAGRFDERDGKLISLGTVAAVFRPTWLVVHPRLPVLFAESAAGDDGKSEGSVLSYAIDRDSGALRELSRVNAGGGGPAHIALDRRSQTLFAAHYGTGQVTSFPVRADGTLGAIVSNITHTGSGPSPRQTHPRAHAVVVDPTGKFLLVADLGADRVFVYRIHSAQHRLTQADSAFVQVAPGSGPRHLAFHPNGRFVYLLNELSSDVVSFRWQAREGRLQPLQTVSAASPDFTGLKSSAEIVLSRDGLQLYFSNRAESSIIVFAVNARDGSLQEIQRIDSGGKVPWSFTIAPSGNWLLVANQGSNNVAVFQRDPKTGRLTPTVQSLPVQRPCNITFVPGRR